MSATNKRMDLTRTTSFCPPPETVLLDSVKKNDTETVEVLIKANKALLSYKYPFTAKTIVATACSEEGVHPLTIQTLIELGADLEGDAEYKPVHLAAQNPESDILKTVINYLKPGQINDTVEGNTPLHSLVKCQRIKENDAIFCENIRLLLKNEINVNQSDRKNVSAILWAAKHGYKNAIETILEESVDHVDLDNHHYQNQSARTLIEMNDLYSGSLPGIYEQSFQEKLFSLLKESKEQDFIDCFRDHPDKDLINLDDRTWTMLQYGCANCLTKVVGVLLEKGAKVNLTIKNDEKSPIELVAENGYYEIFRMLLDDPNVEVPSRVLCYITKQSNVKFPNIDFEKCCKMLLKKLESNRKIVDVNFEDDMTNTPLHYSLRYADEETTQQLLKLGASLASKNAFGIMPIEDIKPELLEKHLNECVKFDFNEMNFDNFKVTFNYNTLIPMSKSNPETEMFAYMSQSPELKALLTHPVIFSFLLTKWHKIRKVFYTNLLFSILFVVSLIIHIFTRYVNFDRKTSSDSCTAIGNIFWYILNVTLWILVPRQLFQIIISPRKYFQNFANYIEILLSIITIMILYVNSPSIEKQLASVAILLGALELVLKSELHPKLSTYAVMLKTVSANFFKLLLWYFLLLIAFALSFYILFDDDSFDNPLKSIFQTIIMLTGELDADSIKFDTYNIASRLIFLLFVFMITIVLFNLLNGLAVGDTQTIRSDAELVAHTSRVQHMYYIESMLVDNNLPSFVNIFKKKLFKSLSRKIWLFTSAGNYRLTVLPNDRGNSSLFDEFVCELGLFWHAWAILKRE
jgi:transient receptor potential cation channel subfamily A protein 1